MKITTKIAGLLLLLICGLAHAEWVVYGETKDGRVFSYDPARVSTNQYSGTVKVWYKETGSAQYTLHLAHIDCSRQTHSPKEWVAYSTDGSVLERFKFKFIPIYDWEEIYPGTLMEVLMNTVCNKR